ncbi:MAG: hypothetical protein H8E82_08475 [Candidatus Marinimicrobia bacterium]|nr:hypothetical protein [Candidatus Neomarinimicrobiota bacterium]
MGNLVMILTDMFSNDLSACQPFGSSRASPLGAGGPSFPSPDKSGSWDLPRRGLRDGLDLSSLLAGLFADVYRRRGDETCRSFDGLIRLPTDLSGYQRRGGLTS